jgi:hypothetical protein
MSGSDCGWLTGIHARAAAVSFRGCTTVSIIVFHSPQLLHCPDHRG